MFTKCKNSNGYKCNLCDGVMVVGKEFMKKHREEHKIKKAEEILKQKLLLLKGGKE